MTAHPTAVETVTPDQIARVERLRDTHRKAANQTWGGDWNMGDSQDADALIARVEDMIGRLAWCVDDYQNGTHLLNAPCLWCGYNGAGYWGVDSHGEDCPWRTVGGLDVRLDMVPGVVATTIRDLLTYATTVRQERDEARKGISQLIDIDHGAWSGKMHALWCNFQRRPLGEAFCNCPIGRDLFKARQQVAALTAQLAEARKAP